MAREGVMICGSVTRGKEIVGIDAELISYSVGLASFPVYGYVSTTFFSRFVASIRTSVSGLKL